MELTGKRIVIYLPNLCGTTGGGEVYGLLLAESLRERNHVVILTLQPEDAHFNVNDVYDRYAVSRFRTEFTSYLDIRYLVGLQFSFKLWKRYSSYDLFINCTMGRTRGMRSIPSVHIIHFPVNRYEGLFHKVLDHMYVSSYKAFFCNSEFTRKYLRQYWGVEGQLLYPPINMTPADEGTIKQKERTILSVGRLIESKCFVEMIGAFKQLYDSGYRDYRYVIIGNKSLEERAYYNQLVEDSKGFPIEIHTDINQDELVSWYRRASIFWHAKGYGKEHDPIMLEHFGMSTAEAMTNGCLPVVIDLGGQREIVQHGFDGFRWRSLEDLVGYTIEAIEDKPKADEMRLNAVESAKRFSYDAFRNTAHSLLLKLLEGGTDSKHSVQNQRMHTDGTRIRRDTAP